MNRSPLQGLGFGLPPPSHPSRCTCRALDEKPKMVFSFEIGHIPVPRGFYIFKRHPFISPNL
jgi:hypothetical protein